MIDNNVGVFQLFSKVTINFKFI